MATSTAKNRISAAKTENTRRRMRCSSSPGPRRSPLQSSSPPPPPLPPVGRRSTGGLPPIPGSFGSVSAGANVKVVGMVGLRVTEITPIIGLVAPRITQTAAIARRLGGGPVHGPSWECYARLGVKIAQVPAAAALSTNSL
jgi:hypothetical protein